MNQIDLLAEKEPETQKVHEFKMTASLCVLASTEDAAIKEGLSDTMVRFLLERKLSHALDSGAAEDVRIRDRFRGRMAEIDELLGLLRPK